MTEIIERDLTPEEIAEREAYHAPEAVYEREYKEVQRQRQAAYSAPGGADEMRAYIDEDEARGGKPRFTKAQWLAEKDRVRELHPYPQKPSK